MASEPAEALEAHRALCQEFRRASPEAADASPQTLKGGDPMGKHAVWWIVGGLVLLYVLNQQNQNSSSPSGGLLSSLGL